MKEQTKDNATARPWQIGGWGKIYGPGDMPRIDGGLSHNEAVEIAKVKNGAFGVYDAKPGERAKANAALIVKAVNSHDALVEALKQVQKLMEGDNTVSPFALCSYNDEDTILDQINTALKLAKEA